MPVGLLADRLDKNHAVAALGCGACALAWLIPGLGGAVCAGVGNALFHVGGGLDTLNRSDSRCGALGIFVSPGADVYKRQRCGWHFPDHTTKNMRDLIYFER